MSSPKYVVLLLISFIIQTLAYCINAQEDPDKDVKLKHEIAFTISASLDKNNLITYDQVTLSKPEIGTFNIHYRLGLINGGKLDLKLALGIGFNTIVQNTTYTNLSNNVNSNHIPTNILLPIYIAPVLTYQLFKMDEINFGIDLLPGAEVSVFSRSEPSVISSDYQDPTGGDEIGRFEIQNPKTFIPSIQFNLWCLIGLETQNLKPFAGLKLTSYNTSSSLTYANGNTINYPDQKLQYFLNLGLTLQY